MTSDLAVVGAGPAGSAAALLAAELGLDTVLIDEQGSPGGQIYRAVETAASNSPLGASYLAGKALVAALRASPVRHRPATAVWHIEPGILSVIADGRGEQVAARHILLATGALERPMPIPGWTLPGVMSAGGAQILLKQPGLVPEGRTVLAGQGALLYLVAAQLVQAGAPPALILETTPATNYRQAAASLVGGRPGLGPLARGLGLIRTIRRAGVPIRRRVSGLRALAGPAGVLDRVAWDGGECAADLLLLHDGVIPDVQISQALQLAHHWDPAQSSWRPTIDSWGRTSLPGISIAGDCGGILGAEAAGLSGRMAALDIAVQLGRLDEGERRERARPLLPGLDRARRLRRFLDVLYRPTAATLLPPFDDIVACRCEEVTVGRVRAAARLGATGPNQLKAFTRCGMGPCQGRICGPIVAALIADTRGESIVATGTYRPRAPYKPITLGTLADSDDGAA